MAITGDIGSSSNGTDGSLLRFPLSPETSLWESEKSPPGVMGVCERIPDWPKAYRDGLIRSYIEVDGITAEDTRVDVAVVRTVFVERFVRLVLGFNIVCQ